MTSLPHRAPSGWCRSRHPAVRRSRDWRAPAGVISPAIRRVRRPAATDRRRAPESAPPVRSRRDRPRAAAPPRFPARRAPTSTAASRRRYRRARARQCRNHWRDDRSCGQRGPRLSRPRTHRNSRLGKRLGGEIYVASEASATPLRNYALQSNFLASRCVAVSWTDLRPNLRPDLGAGPGTGLGTGLGLNEYRCYPAPTFPCRKARTEAFARDADRHQASHFRRIFIMTSVDHSRIANAFRGLAIDAVEKANSGHPGLPMGAADIATVLFTRFLKFDAAEPNWPDRDRFILSAGHGSMLLYALLYLTGNKDMTLDQIKQFRQLGSLTPGHPENFHTKGIETTTGPLGQGIATSVGFALAERHLAAVFGSAIVDHTTYVLASDGDLMEGISQEAIALAGHLKLNKLIVLFDDNGISIDGPLALADSVDQVKRFEAAGWAASRIDGHDPVAIAAALEAAKKSDRPSMIACRTTIGFGAPTKAGKASAHGAALGADEIKGAREKVGWTL